MIDLAIKEAWLAIRRNFLLSLKEYEISESEAYILTIIPKEGINSTSIPLKLGLALGSASSLLIKLEKKNLIKRNVSDTDKRVCIVILTEDGVIKRKIVSSIIINYRNYLIGSFGEKKLTELETTLNEIIQNTNNLKKKSRAKNGTRK